MAKGIASTAHTSTVGHTEALEGPPPQPCAGHCVSTHWLTLEPPTVPYCQPLLPSAPRNVTCQLCPSSANPTWCSHSAEFGRIGEV